jgi:hypothetical protein
VPPSLSVRSYPCVPTASRHRPRGGQGPGLSDDCASSEVGSGPVRSGFPFQRTQASSRSAISLRAQRRISRDRTEAASSISSHVTQTAFTSSSVTQPLSVSPMSIWHRRKQAPAFRKKPEPATGLPIPRQSGHLRPAQSLELVEATGRERTSPHHSRQPSPTLLSTGCGFRRASRCRARAAPAAVQ